MHSFVATDGCVSMFLKLTRENPGDFLQWLGFEVGCLSNDSRTTSMSKLKPVPGIWLFN